MPASASAKSVNINSAQARWFKFRRSGLMEPFDDPAETAQRLIGVQAQLPVASDLAVYNRVAGVTQESLSQERLQKRSIVRMWGQRNTVHLYATEDWPLLERWFRDRTSVMASKLDEAGLTKEFEQFVKYLERRLQAGEPLTYKDAKSYKGYEKLDVIRRRWAENEDAYAASDWLIGYAGMMRLVRDGLICHGPDESGESTFVHRDWWVPKLKWKSLGDQAAFAEAAVRYFRTYGPATPHDLASYFGTTLTAAKAWIDNAGERLRPVEVDGRKSFIVADDLEEVLLKVPSPGKWPVCMLFRFDPYVLGAVGSKNKEWLLDKAHFKKVWRPGAHIEAVILEGGRITGTWRYRKKSKGLDVEIKPFESFSKRVAREIEKKAKGIAAFLGTELIALK